MLATNLRYFYSAQSDISKHSSSLQNLWHRTGVYGVLQVSVPRKYSKHGGRKSAGRKTWRRTHGEQLRVERTKTFSRATMAMSQAVHAVLSEVGGMFFLCVNSMSPLYIPALLLLQKQPYHKTPSASGTRVCLGSELPQVLIFTELQ